MNQTVVFYGYILKKRNRFVTDMAYNNKYDAVVYAKLDIDRLKGTKRKGIEYESDFNKLEKGYKLGSDSGTFGQQYFIWRTHQGLCGGA